MALEKYKKKRDASVTPEPFGGRSTDNELHFVVQKHAATRLHYDFRLEMKGVLKSWAVPKGPSTDPDIKRLAMMVEDHPYDYRTFEGIIPKGEYGGGTVIVWDEGTYEASGLEGKSKKVQEKHLLEKLSGGDVKVTLHGKKLKGEYALFRLKDNTENTWLMKKHKDEYASKTDITLKDKSVQSGKTIEKVKATSKNIYTKGVSKEEKKKKDSKVKFEESAITDSEASNPLIDIKTILKKAVKENLPEKISPMLATPVNEPFDNEEWLFEVKWDGYRTIGFINNGKSELFSRNNKLFTDKYYPISNSLKNWKFNAVIDGEIIVINDEGKSDFGALQNWRSEADGELILYIFDLLWYEGKNLMSLPLSDRQAILKAVFIDDDDTIRLNQVFPTNGKDFFLAAEKLGLEGIIAKKTASKYHPGYRSADWLKIKVHKRQEVVIGGYTINESTGKLLSALLLGVYENGSLQYVGKVGTGFNEKQKKELLELFRPLTIKSSPFEVMPDVNQPSRFRSTSIKAKAFWLKPRLICEVSYSEVTADGVFRHPSYKGLRDDKKAEEVVREKEKEVTELTESEEKDSGEKNKLTKAPKEGSKKNLLNPNEETQVKTISGHELKFTNLSKIYWPEDNLTKRDMINYYYQVAEYILPYLKDRPQSLNRFPNGIHGASFYQKDVKGKSPDWVRTFPYVNGENEHKEFLVGDDEATLLWMASQGSIEMNPWFSRIQAEDYPDYCIIDLDPDKNSFDQVVQAAIEVKKVLDTLDVPSYPKTSGSTGMHIYIPLEAKYTYDQSQMFANLIVRAVHEQIPEFTTIERMVKKRQGKMYLDFLQNRPGATIASPYSARPKPGATVSMPLHWDEVKKGLKTGDFTILNSIDRLKKTGDLFKGVLGKGIDMGKILEKAQAIFQ
jgi:bifunctional non-homologous end joining protein LigD